MAICNTQFRVDPLQNATHRRVLVALTMSLAVTFGATVPFGATSPATAAGVKCQPSVKVTNKKGASIKVLRFLYKVGGSTVYTEGLVNKVLTPNETETWSSQTLNNAATGVVVTSTAVEYKDDTGRGYGSPHTSAWFPHSFTCAANHNYIHEIQ
ncbi:MAG: hypothetical protein J0L70_11055 [Leptolyngbya sp. UWPOB_LEPTO1]|uniref:hypothetical protein n=1 Tax=Leptolyngbya sp. UWPOB_LEPTO1 TaxID=2815653 RepID=UPI001AD3F379|nr:hypothetical protein [Leptolyngbya sp. UWPOB_LEPTO1]MBN8561054.1 hypothetical protein [Leptolyngbya sp. UWPOB_LEPTO1]